MSESIDIKSFSIALASDHAGYGLKEHLKQALEPMVSHVTDFGTDSVESCDYPDFARDVALEVVNGRVSFGILVCATGAGMAITANKFPGARAVACNDLHTAEFCRRHNDANIITIGAKIVEPDFALAILKVFLETPFEGMSNGGERHKRRLEKITDIERDRIVPQ